MAKKQRKPLDDADEEGGNSWCETRNWWPWDHTLRSHGYQIAERRKGKEARWALGKWHPGCKTYSQTEALMRCGY